MRHLLTSIAVAILLVDQPPAQSTELSPKPSPNQAAQQDGGQSGNADNASTPAGSALTTIFSPSRAPKRKTMGLLQRSFLDLADQGDQELEIAIVIDGTESMKGELAGVQQSVRQMLDDLRLYRSNEVRAAVVVYRDAGSPSGEVVIPQKQFTSDQDAITAAVAGLTPESGAPFFHELPDLGIHQALTQLPWTEDDQVTKWILLFGDAPPYAETFKDDDTPQAYRRFATPLLISIATQKNIRINCVLCTSDDSQPYDRVLDETRKFMNAMCAGTDGLMLDLSHPETRQALIDASKQPAAELTKIQPISAIDLAAVRRENLDPSNRIQQVSLAVIPHMPIHQISFDPRNPAVQVSTALRTKLARIPGVRIAGPREIKEKLRRLRAEGLSDEKAIRALAAMLNVDFVVWGSLQADSATVQTAAYRRDNGQQIVPVQLANHTDDMAFVLIQASAKSVPDNQAIAQMFSQMRKLESALAAPMAKGVATSNDLLAAMEALEQALAYEAGSDEAIELLKTAQNASKNASVAEPRNAIAHWLQANVAYNQASRLYQRGETEDASKKMRDVKNSLGRAVEYRESIGVPSLITEIEGDYYLLVERNPDQAVKRYLAMTKTDQPLASQLRGHWMLAGIYAGDWGNADHEIVDADKSRRHITEVLANWPDSPEAKLLKDWLRWDESQEKTEFNYLPRVNVELSGA